jgi:hypothetical protein
MANTSKELQVEASRKKKERAERTPHPGEYRFSAALDFSPALGDDNPYKRQGAASFGPLTSDSFSNVDHAPSSADVDEEAIKEQIKESLLTPSEWQKFVPPPPISGVWSLIERLVDE